MNLQAVGAFFKKSFHWSLFRETYQEWSRDKAARLAASLAFYTTTAMAPLIIGILAITGVIVSRQQAQSALVEQVRTYVGEQGAEIVQTILANADQPELARLAGLFSLLVLLWSASNIFSQLQDSLNTIWGVELRRDLPWLRKIQNRLLPVVSVFVIGILLIVATVASAGISAAGNLVTDLLPGGVLLWQIINFVINLVVITLVFALAFKVLPDVEIAWRDVWPGAALTAVLFVVGQFVLSWYLGRQSGASLYGAAGSLIVLLLWLYYSAQIFLFGAEYTQVFATRYGEGVRPSKDAVARGTGVPAKAAARAASGGAGGRSYKGVYATTEYRALPVKPSDDLPLNTLAVAFLSDLSLLFRQEVRLIRVELQEMVARAVRAVAMMAGGGMALYAALLLVLAAVALLLSGIMPLWFALLLVGLLVLIEGWILAVSAWRKVTQVQLVPKQTVDAVRQDMDEIKQRLTT
jgi:membrane protein